VRQFLITLLLGIIANFSLNAQELVVIVNPANRTTALSHRQLVNLYMGRTQQYPDGTFALPVDQAPDSTAR
jgi:hypothetical protein